MHVKLPATISHSKLIRDTKRTLMEDSAETSWFSDQMVMEDPFVSDPYDITDFLDEELSAAFGGDEQFFQNSLLSQQCNSSSPYSSAIMIPRNSSTTSLSADSNTENQNQTYYNSVVPSPLFLSFGAAGNNNVITNNDALVSDAMANSRGDDQDASLKKAATVPTKKKTGGRTRPPSQTYDHIIAERKRREQLSQQFVALSSIVPGLKKMDKTTVLGDTIKYMKQLQEREKALEARATMQMMESMVLVKKSQVVDDGVEADNDGDEESSEDRREHEQPLPDIEAKVCDEKHILLRIMCEKHKGVLVKILSELERCNLGVTSTNVAPFGSLALDITIVTEMRENFSLSTSELVGVLGSTIRRRRS